MVWVKRAGALLFVLLVAAVVAFVVYAWRTLPMTDGQLRVAQASALKAEVQIERDERGIPTIRAASLVDAAFALGVVHAQDRLWQLETHKRIASGSLAEAFGEAALDTDRFIRALGVRRAAAAQWAKTQGLAREMLVAYAGGIRSVVRDRLQARAPEFLILGIEPSNWEPVDSLAWAIMMAWDLGGNWSTELLRMRLALQMPASVAQIDALLPPYPGEAPLVTADYPALYRQLGLGRGGAQAWLDLPEIAPPSGIEGVGSNNWVVAGSHTTSGKPLLANDPHLKLTTPALWYFVRIETPAGKMAGASMPGLPGIVLGQNEHIAWGFTNTGPDVQDLYIEEVDATDPGRYRTPEGTAAFERFDEVIKVRGKPEVTLTVRGTRHGPVISDAGQAGDVLGATGRGRHVLALRWTALDDDVDPLGAQLAMVQARSVAEFAAAAQRWQVPMQNMVVADRAGRIGLIAPGRVPLRKAENDLRGHVPAPGWDARYDWAGWVPPEETPREFDPARGWIATANQRVFGPDYPHHLGSEWALPYRQLRIEQMLQGRPKHAIEDLAAMQADRQSLAAARLIPHLRQARSDHPLAPSVRPLLDTFDGSMAPDQAAPLVYWAWLRQLGIAVLGDDLGDKLATRTQGRSWFDALDGILQRQDGTWCDDRRTAEVRETCAQIVDRAFTAALDELQARLGGDVSRWRWGDVHQLRAEHRPFSRVRPLARWFELRAPLGGDTYTVNVSRVVLRPDGADGALYHNDHGASLRALYDLGDPRQSRVMQSSGQSGILFSPHFRDFVEPWAAVQYVPLWASGPPKHRLVLLPP